MRIQFLTSLRLGWRRSWKLHVYQRLLQCDDAILDILFLLMRPALFDVEQRALGHVNLAALKADLCTVKHCLQRGVHNCTPFLELSYRGDTHSLSYRGRSACLLHLSKIG